MDNIGNFNSSSQTNLPAVTGTSTASNGVHGVTSSNKDNAVFAEHTGQGIGVFATSARGLAGFFQGNVGVTGDNTPTGGQDCAERFDVLDAKEYDPGNVMTIDESGALVRCHSGYDRRAGGVISGAGNLRPGIIFDGEISAAGRVPISGPFINGLTQYAIHRGSLIKLSKEDNWKNYV